VKANVEIVRKKERLMCWVLCGLWSYVYRLYYRVSTSSIAISITTLWDIWRGSSPKDKVHVTDHMAEKFGELVTSSMTWKSLPAAFCRRV
jgi:hypothetical protein